MKKIIYIFLITILTVSYSCNRNKDKNNQVQMAFRNGTWLVNEHSINIGKKENKINGAMNKITSKAGQCKKD